MVATGTGLGLFDPPAGQPDYSNPDLVGSPQNHALSLDASRQGMTLLSNRKAALPLKLGKKLAVIVRCHDAATQVALSPSVLHSSSDGSDSTMVVDRGRTRRRGRSWRAAREVGC